MRERKEEWRQALRQKYLIKYRFDPLRKQILRSRVVLFGVEYETVK